MGEPGGVDGASAFPAVDVEKELNPASNENFEVDSVSSRLAASPEIQEEPRTTERERKEKKKNDSMQTLKTAFIISGVVVAVIGAAFAITKKLREK